MEQKLSDALKGVKLMGGACELQDIRKAAGLQTGGSALADKMMQRGYLKKISRNYYQLTEAGHRCAYDLLYGKKTA